MKAQIEAIQNEALEALNLANTKNELEDLRVKYLGKKGALTAVLKQMGSLSAEERPVIGQVANVARAAIEKVIAEKSAEISEKELLIVISIVLWIQTL